MATINLQTKGMHCNSCEMLISEALEEISGIENTKADHKTGKISVDFDEGLVEVTTIKHTIEEEGFQVM